jgi:hypothetical protein
MTDRSISKNLALTGEVFLFIYGLLALFLRQYLGVEGG